MATLDLLADEEQQISPKLLDLFQNVNRIESDPDRPIESQVSEIEQTLGYPPIEKMLIYSGKYETLGLVLSRRYLSAAKIGNGPLRLAETVLFPDHLSFFPSDTRKNRILFLAPHCDEAYLAAILPHTMMGDKVYLHTFTFPEGEKNRLRSAYNMLGLEDDDYSLGSLKANRLFEETQLIADTIRRLIDEIEPTTVFSVFPEGANFDHMAVAQVTRRIVLKESTADLIYGYVLQSRKRNPVIFPILTESVYGAIMKAFGKQGLGTVFKKYLPFLEWHMRTYSEPLLRMIGNEKLKNIYSLPLEAERIRNYRIPNTIQAFENTTHI
jgi:hypothetical protein